MLNVIVCVKIIIDPEMPFSIFAIDKEKLSPVPPSGMPPVVNPYDENALEAALKIKDSQECKITVLSVGNSLPKAVLQKVLAVGADQVFAVDDPDFEILILSIQPRS
jgi:electron transfer flavoprotein beta subunit